MDQRSTEAERKAELIARLEASRARVGTGRHRLRENLHPVRRLRRSVKDHPFRTFGIAAGAAFAVSVLLRRSPAKQRPFSLKRTLVSWALGAAKPALRLWLLNEAKTRFLKNTGQNDGHTGSDTSFP
jgi:hypothetical protein